ncbi:MAG: MFS transporter [Polyangiaceae bacterium]|nr:MFS transporter [Polyangiaceae bacterium]
MGRRDRVAPRGRSALARLAPVTESASPPRRGSVTAASVPALAVWSRRAFRRYMAARLVVTFALQALGVAVGWQVYDITRDPLHLGWVGLAQFLPMLLLALPGGQVADRHSRRRVVIACFVVFAIGAGALAVIATVERPPLALLYAVLVLLGSARAFYGPATGALVPNLVPRDELPSAIAWGSTVWQLATVLGPALGGALYAATGPVTTYVAVAGLALIAAGLTTRVRVEETHPREVRSVAAVLAGVRYVVSDRVLLGAISLDLFAVLLGGSVALLPAIARDVLAVGPAGLGALRAAPATGAAVVAVALALRPLRRRAGVVMLASVAIFGGATIVVGLSRSFELSLAALALLGAADMVSVFVRHTLIQLRTPDAMRGRVGAVSLVFISASNELGELESGLTAAWLGVERAIVAGGLGTLLVVLAASRAVPDLRAVRSLSPES